MGRLPVPRGGFTLSAGVWNPPSIMNETWDVIARGHDVPEALTQPSFPVPAPDQPFQFSKLAENLVGDLRGIGPDDPARSKKRPTRELGALIEELMQKHQIGRSSPEQNVRDRWAEIVGASNAAHSHPARIERNRLLVLVPHSVVRNELFLHREEIVERVRKVPGCETVRSLLLRAG